MHYALSAAVEVIAAAIDDTSDSIMGAARRLQEIDAIPRSPGGRLPALLTSRHLALLLITLLINRPRHEAARLAVELGDYRNQRADAAGIIGKMLEAAGAAEVTAKSVLTAKTALTVHTGARDAVVLRFSCEDGPLEEAFTFDGGAWEPDHDESISTARTLPGRLLHRIGRDLAEVAA